MARWLTIESTIMNNFASKGQVEERATRAPVQPGIRRRPRPLAVALGLASLFSLPMKTKITLRQAAKLRQISPHTI